MGGEQAATTASVASDSTGSSTAFAALTGISALTQILSGFSAMSASRDESALLEQQAGLLEEESDIRARQRAREVDKFRAKQGHQFVSSGITLEGSPLLVLEETRRLGQEEVDAIRRRGQARATLTRAKAGITRKRGRASFLGSLFGAAGTGAQGFILGKRLGVFGTKPKANSDDVPGGELIG